MFEIDMSRCSKRFLDPARSNQGGRSIETINIPDFFWNIDEALCADFLQDQIHRKKHGKEIRCDRLQRLWVEHRRGRHRAVGHDVVPGFRQVGLRRAEIEFEKSGFVTCDSS